MKNKGIIILCIILSIVGLTAFGFSNNQVSENPIKDKTEIDSITVNKGLPYFGIKIDYRTGKETKIAPFKPELSYMVVRGSIGPNSLVSTGRAISEEKLKNAQTICDVIENYPSNWITDYNSVTVATTVNGKTIEAIGPDEKLTSEQKEIFKTASNVLLVVQYQKENNKNEIQNRQMNVALIVTPQIEAEYIGGYEKMISYLKDESLNVINDKNFSHLPQPSISFVITAQGTVENVKLEASSRDEEVDALLIKAIQNMPSWKPATNKDGVNIKQEFILNIGQDGC
jgi:TonB family protein